MNQKKVTQREVWDGGWHDWPEEISFARSVCCPHCRAMAGNPCRTPKGALYRDWVGSQWHTRHHVARTKRAREALL